MVGLQRQRGAGAAQHGVRVEQERLGDQPVLQLVRLVARVGVEEPDLVELPVGRRSAARPAPARGAARRSPAPAPRRVPPPRKPSAASSPAPRTPSPDASPPRARGTRRPRSRSRRRPARRTPGRSGPRRTPASGHDRANTSSSPNANVAEFAQPVGVRVAAVGHGAGQRQAAVRRLIVKRSRGTMFPCAGFARILLRALLGRVAVAPAWRRAPVGAELLATRLVGAARDDADQRPPGHAAHASRRSGTAGGCTSSWLTRGVMVRELQHGNYSGPIPLLEASEQSTLESRPTGGGADGPRLLVRPPTRGRRARRRSSARWAFGSSAATGRRRRRAGG